MSSNDLPAPPRYVVGIDLGTTNSALAFVDTERPEWRVEAFSVPQLVAPATVEARETLPSFHYAASVAEQAGGALRLPWDKDTPPAVVGSHARDRGASAPGRLVTSAKSWLSHAGVDRSAALLPWQGADDVTKVSPVRVSSRYLEHLRRAWDEAHGDAPLARQDVVLTVPASFDEVARELTVAAAKQAGLPRVVLIEEPQAAFYAWMDAQAEERGDRVEEAVEAGETVLVCDVGGGTSDFSLIEARAGKEEGEVRFHRIAVGDHLILGGDNLDLALARHLEERWKEQGQRVEPRQWSELVNRCRKGKEILLGEQAPERVAITLAAGGSRLIGGAMTAELTRETAAELLLEGFLPRVSIGARPMKRSGFQEFGLPYAPDSAITRYLAAFLQDHGEGDSPARPTSVLLNGGFFEAAALRRRFLEVLGSWLGGEPRLLRHARLDLAVAQGAAYYGTVRRGRGQRIEAGLARTYYVGVDRASGEPRAALCLVPAGLREGESVEVREHRLDLRIRQPVEFPIFTSSLRTTDKPGELVEVDPKDLSALAPIRTVLRSGKNVAAEVVQVYLTGRLTEIGTLELGCREAVGNRSWKLQFDVRSAVRTDLEQHQGEGEQKGFADEATVAACEGLVRAAFAGDSPPDRLVQRLEHAAGSGRLEWPPSLLRALWQVLIDHEEGRRRSVAHEARWLNLLGFSLRPGYGYGVDDWRVAQTWRLSHSKVAHGRNDMCRAEWWVMWRRIAGGLAVGQQRALCQPLVPGMKSLYGAGKKGSRLKAGPHELAEIWRLFGALEGLEPELRRWLGDTALGEALRGEGALSGAPAWALARLGARVPASGPLNVVIPVDAVEGWLERLLAAPIRFRQLPFLLMQLGRKTGDRYRDVDPGVAARLAARLEELGKPRYATLVRDGGELEDEDRGLIFGDQLPVGLALR